MDFIKFLIERYGYYAMYQICGDRANFTYVCEPLEQSVQHILTF